MSHTWTGLPRQATDEHFPRKERRFHQARRPAAGHWRKRKRTRGDCQQRVTSGTTLRPPAQSPALGSRCHHTSTNNRTTPVSVFPREHVTVTTRPKTGSSDRGQNVSLFLGPASPFNILLSFVCGSPHTSIADRSTNSSTKSLLFFSIQ